MIEEFISFGLHLLEKFHDYYNEASLETKRKMLSSILDEKLEIQDGKYRTPRFKEGFEFIYRSTNVLRAPKTKTGDLAVEVSRLVHRTGREM